MGIAKPASAFILATGLFAAFPTTSGAAYNYFDPLDNSQAPALISATGFYDNIATKQVTARAIPFEVNTPLWSDAAGKKRWVILKPNTFIRYQDTANYYEYPDSAVFVKEFAIDTVPGDTTTRILWETRFLILKKDTSMKMDQWYGFTYRWNRQGTDARLVNPITGEFGAVRYFPKGRTQPAEMKKWAFPSQTDCNNCHRLTSSSEMQARGVLGFFTAQLNRNVRGSNGQMVNQLTRLFDAGVFQNITPRPNFAAAPKWAALTDNTASLDLRARSYLAANCSGCHSERGKKNSALGHGCYVNFDFHDMKKTEEFPESVRNGALEYQSTSNGNPDTDTLNFIVHPKHPEYSSIIWRLQAENTDTVPVDTSLWSVSAAFEFRQRFMPPIGRYQADTTAIRVLSEWINTLTERPISVRHANRKPGSLPRIQGGLIHVEGAADLPATAWLVDTRGVRTQVMAAGPGRYRLPARTAPGIYTLMLGGNRAYRVLLP